MQDRMGQLWELQMYTRGSLGTQGVLVLVIRSDLDDGMHRVLVIDGGTTGWRDGQLRMLGELVEWPNVEGSSRRVA